MSDGQWQLEGTAAELFERYLVPAITAKWAVDLLDRAQPHEGEAVLDIACGTGIVARLAAKRMGRGLVTGLDLNAGMLNVARSAPTEGATIVWTEGSALDLPFPADSFDMALCQQGLQFFPDQRKALGEICRVLKGGGRAALSVYSRIERTPGRTHSCSRWMMSSEGTLLGSRKGNIPSRIRGNLRHYYATWGSMLSTYRRSSKQSSFRR